MLYDFYMLLDLVVVYILVNNVLLFRFRFLGIIFYMKSQDLSDNQLILELEKEKQKIKIKSKFGVLYDGRK